MGHFGVPLGSLWDRFGVIWVSFQGHFWVIRATLKPYVSHFDVEMPTMGHVMAIRAAWWGRKANMLKNHWFLYVFLRVKAAMNILGKSCNRAGRNIFGPLWGQQTEIFDKKCCVAIYRIVSPTRARNTFSEKSWNENEKNHARSHRKEKNGARRA